MQISLFSDLMCILTACESFTRKTYDDSPFQGIRYTKPGLSAAAFLNETFQRRTSLPDLLVLQLRSEAVLRFRTAIIFFHFPALEHYMVASYRTSFAHRRLPVNDHYHVLVRCSCAVQFPHDCPDEYKYQVP